LIRYNIVNQIMCHIEKTSFKALLSTFLEITMSRNGQVIVHKWTFANAYRCSQWLINQAFFERL